MSVDLGDRELDARIAIALFGWRWWKRKTGRGLCALYPPESAVGWTRANFFGKHMEEVEEPGELFSDWSRAAIHETTSMQLWPEVEHVGLPRYSKSLHWAWKVVEFFNSDPDSQTAQSFYRIMARESAKRSRDIYYSAGLLEWREPDAARLICESAIEAKA